MWTKANVLIAMVCLSTALIRCDKKPRGDSSHLVVSAIPGLVDQMARQQVGIDSLAAAIGGRVSRPAADTRQPDGLLPASVPRETPPAAEATCIEIVEKNRFFPDSLRPFWGDWEVTTVAQANGSQIVFPETKRYRNGGPISGEIDENGRLRKLCF